MTASRNASDSFLRALLDDAAYAPRLPGPRDAAIRQITALALGTLVPPEAVAAAAEAVIARESAATTGIGQGVAVPHAIVLGLAGPRFAWASFDPPIDWPALDGRPTAVACFAFAPPAKPGTAMRADGRLVRLLANDRFRDALLRAGRDSADAAALRAAVIAAAREVMG
jgi:mannitol/fructose-specific phosphotransferase system IIA component (Ntr-type)